LAEVAAPDPCARCGAALAPGSLACPRCHALAHACRLEELASRARAQEQNHELAAARADWQAALELLPADSSQAAWVRGRLAELARAGIEPARAGPPAWTRRLGPLAPLAVLLLKGKLFLSLLKLPFLLSFAGFVGLYWALYGMKFGIGLSLLVLVHELGHFIELKRRRLTADLPMFIPGVGAYVRWTAAGITPGARTLVSLAGPLAGACGAALCVLIWQQTHARLWLALASFSALINVMNLIPVWRLDGAQAIEAIDRSGRIGIALAALLLAAWLAQPLLLLVAGAAGYRAFAKERGTPIPPGYGLAAYFILVLAALSYLAALTPPGAPPY
jgi:Zn-dependent protease